MFRLIIGGVTVMDFAIAGFTTIAAHVADVANRVNTHPWARSVVTAVASGTSLYLFYLEKPHSSQVDISAGSVGADGGGGNSSAAQPNRPLGTIQSVNWVTNTITLAANSLIPLPVGALVGIPIDVSMVLGITGNTYLLETTHSHMVADSNDIPAFTHGCLYPARVPHWDKQFASVLPGITVMV
jgi:hypothetical protein